MRDEPRDPLRIAFYTRISTDEDHQKYSLGAQKDRLEAFCKAQWDDAWRLHTVYRDTESGTHMHRPGLEEMLDDAAAQAFDTLLVFRVDRLSRKVRELAQMVDELTKNSVTLKSITEPFDTSNPAGKMMLQMLGVFAEFEHATIVERTKVGMEKKARGGDWVGGVVPYGYQLDPEKGLVLAQDEAVIVKKMFKMYAVGKEGTHTIGHTLNGAGYRNRRGKKWDKRVILNMIKNPLYVGKLRWKDVLYEGTHDPIISDVLFEKTQAILQQRAQDLNGRRFHNRDARLLAGTITCARCQSHMVGVSTHKKARRFPYYICSKRWNIKDCDQDYVRADLLEAGIMKDVKTVFRDEANRRLSAEKPDVDQELGKVETQAAQTQARIDRYFEAFEAGTLKPALCNEKVQRLTARLEELEAERQALEGRRKRLALPVIDKETLSGVVANFEDVMAAGTTPQQKHVLHHLVKKVLVHDRRTVEVWYGLPNPPSVSRPGKLAPQVGLEPTTLRLTAGCSAIELLRNRVARSNSNTSGTNSHGQTAQCFKNRGPYPYLVLALPVTPSCTTAATNANPNQASANPRCPVGVIG